MPVAVGAHHIALLDFFHDGVAPVSLGSRRKLKTLSTSNVIEVHDPWGILFPAIRTGAVLHFADQVIQLVLVRGNELDVLLPIPGVPHLPHVAGVVLSLDDGIFVRHEGIIARSAVMSVGASGRI